MDCFNLNEELFGIKKKIPIIFSYIVARPIKVDW